MKLAGIVSEYNPMHKGHMYHIEETRKNGATHIVSVMSGNFVQRGECAFVDKWARADIAVHNGIDLVVELPTPWSMDSAENFAFGAASILSSLGINILSFGSETDDISLLERCAVFSDSELSFLINESIKKGSSYPLALKEAVSKVYGEKEAQVISSPNSTLGIEYIKALRKLCSKAEILAVKRKGAMHDSDNISGELVSASALRNLAELKDIKPFVSSYELSALTDVYKEGYAPVIMKNGERAVLSALRNMSAEELSRFTVDKRGLSDRIYKAVRASCGLDELYEAVKTKNVTMAKVRRTVMRAYLGISPEISKEKPPYIKVLAANEKGLEILKNYKGDVPLITKYSDTSDLSAFAKEVYDLECRCTDLYALFSKKIRACGLEQTSSLKIIR